MKMMIFRLNCTHSLILSLMRLMMRLMYHQGYDQWWRPWWWPWWWCSGWALLAPPRCWSEQGCSHAGAWSFHCQVFIIIVTIIMTMMKIVLIRIMITIMTQNTVLQLASTANSLFLIVLHSLDCFSLFWALLVSWLFWARSDATYTR